MSEVLDHIQIEPDQAANATVIWLHGLGADGHDFEPIVPELKLPESHAIRFIFPHAPKRSITINEGEEMRAWYDFIPHSETEGGDDIDMSAKQIEAFIEREMDRGIDNQQILLAGFSQGGVIALQTALRSRVRLAGVLALSTYLYDLARTERERTDENLAIPVMMAHGTGDPMIPIMRAATSRENLIRLGYDVRWFDYPMGHQVCMEEVEEISRFFQELLCSTY
ncbi:MAG TPA: dienelactone hydrolase family protein [Pseudomonadales bacterium]|jgi:phospholipase/carboxylesterase|nr:carboxylesterase [Gammaproteobacteria bacterium]MDP6026905.1 dienelactone hydrolase family protein [Pseudomonadales bacterium]MDP6316408.1 dienelactone hydrolase family protein [Pseudomonadales bacterium]MDP7314998.1 dienelactone hydrolase family protein [Pseudomonadales bacterium]HJL60959.1 dienelactone hydrolase family protein [Pseudomonadales bacterium]|tara:strand:- start:32864 stop:33535 length:672 start_codon:yes stop_codon:yes gene_type:complete